MQTGICHLFFFPRNFTEAPSSAILGMANEVVRVRGKAGRFYAGTGWDGLKTADFAMWCERGGAG